VQRHDRKPRSRGLATAALVRRGRDTGGLRPGAIFLARPRLWSPAGSPTSGPRDPWPMAAGARALAELGLALHPRTRVSHAPMVAARGNDYAHPLSGDAGIPEFDGGSSTARTAALCRPIVLAALGPANGQAGGRAPAAPIRTSQLVITFGSSWSARSRSHSWPQTSVVVLSTDRTEARTIAAGTRVFTSVPEFRKQPPAARLEAGPIWSARVR